MKEKTKKALLMAGLIAAGVLLVAGISMRLYKQKKADIPASTETAPETEVVVDTEPEVIPEKDEEEELVIETETKTDIKTNEQDLQPDPVKTEEEKPSKAPEVKEDTDVENPVAEPEYKEDTTTPTGQNTGTSTDTPSNGQTKDGMIYIDGFGWVPDEGGGGVGIQDDQIYENGNKIGTMD